jgi:hypothetical protein
MIGEKRAQNGQRLLYYYYYLLAVQFVALQATALLEPCLDPNCSKNDLPSFSICGKGRSVEQVNNN